MSDVAPELSAWVVDNRCSYEIAPIVELKDGDRTEVGFELDLRAELPWKGASTPQLRAKADEIKGKPTELVDVLVPKDSKKARFEIVPYRRAVKFLRGEGLPQITRTVRIFHRDFENVEPEDRAKFRPFEERLRSIGFKKA